MKHPPPEPAVMRHAHPWRGHCTAGNPCKNPRLNGDSCAKCQYRARAARVELIRERALARSG